jgi:hypothetical protein
LSFALPAAGCIIAKKFKMILLSNLHRFVEQGKFSITFVAEDGEVVHYPDAVCTSWHSRGRTMNVKLITSNQPRTIRRCTVIAFNDEEVAL